MIDKYQKVKLGIIARADNRGLGIQSWEFYRHLKPFKTLVLQFKEEKNFPERFKKNVRIANNIISQQDIDWLLDGIDVLISFETFYNSLFFSDNTLPSFSSFLLAASKVPLCSLQ